MELTPQKHHSPVHQCILEQWSDCIDIVLSHLSDVLKEERKRLQNSILHVQLRDTVLVHQGWNHGEWGARLCDDRYGNGCADTILPLLYFEVVKESRQYILRTGRREGREGREGRLRGRGGKEGRWGGGR